MTDEEAGYILAFELKDHAIKQMQNPDGAVLLYACCWLLADLTLQAHVIKGYPVEEAMGAIVAKLEVHRGADVRSRPRRPRACPRRGETLMSNFKNAHRRLDHRHDQNHQSR